MSYRVRTVVRIILSLVLAAGIAGLFYMSLVADKNGVFEAREDEYAGLALPYIDVSEFGDEIALVNGAVLELMGNGADGMQLYHKYSASGNAYAVAEPTLNYAVFDLPEGVKVESQTVELTRTSHNKDVQTYRLNGYERSITFKHLCTDSTYYYRITAQLSNGGSIKTAGSFETMASPRLLSVDGISNVRDIGGYMAENGKTVKQGMVYRGSELKGKANSGHLITENGKYTLVEELGVKTELDLRQNVYGKTKSELGETVSRYGYNVPAYKVVKQKYAAQPIQKLFSALSQKALYPVYLHCADGVDKTGTVCFLLDMLLGVSQGDAYRNWELSVLHTGELDYDAMSAFLTEFDALEGETDQKKAENYLLSIGVTEQEIRQIKDILLED